jgi:hypothetical protein
LLLYALSYQIISLEAAGPDRVTKPLSDPPEVSIAKSEHFSLGNHAPFQPTPSMEHSHRIPTMHQLVIGLFFWILGLIQILLLAIESILKLFPCQVLVLDLCECDSLLDTTIPNS